MASERILVVGTMSRGSTVLRVAPPVEEQPVDGLLQQLIDEAADTDEYADWLLDEEWMRRGC
jgi:hypothetical protein